MRTRKTAASSVSSSVVPGRGVNSPESSAGENPFERLADPWFCANVPFAPAAYCALPFSVFQFPGVGPAANSTYPQRPQELPQQPKPRPPRPRYAVQPWCGVACETPAGAASQHARVHALPKSLHPAHAALLWPLPKTPATPRSASNGLSAPRQPLFRAVPRRYHGPGPVQSLPLVRSSLHFSQTIPRFHHLATFMRRGTSRNISNFASSRARPRCSRERIVPIGQPVICAASS